jgi:hypothetical protein
MDRKNSKIYSIFLKSVETKLLYNLIIYTLAFSTSNKLQSSKLQSSKLQSNLILLLAKKSLNEPRKSQLQTAKEFPALLCKLKE